MKAYEAALIRRSTGLKIAAMSFIGGLCGVTPLLLYIAFGPADGNPIGLGLLAVLAIPVATVGIIVGSIKWLVETLTQRGA